jgi:gamma-glutamyl phosphate reductase
MQTSSLLQKASEAKDALNRLTDKEINEILLAIAAALEANQDFILSANQKDLQRMELSDPKYDRLRLTADRIRGIAGDMRSVTSLPSPLDKIQKEIIRPNGMVIRKVSVPFGVIGVIYEARPNVTCDVLSLCLKSGNVCVLKGGSDAEYSNEALVKIIHGVVEQHGLAKEVCTLLPAEREATDVLLKATKYVDLIIPRGSAGLINFVRENSLVPIIETGAGICHTYFDKDGDRNKGQAIITNAKTRRVSVCNALDCLIIHADRLSDLPFLCAKLKDSRVIIYADKDAYTTLKGNYPDELLEKATEDSFGTEFLDYKMSIRTVSSEEEALRQISRYSSKHSECIVSESREAIQLFERMVDAACVYANVSTAFTDGAQFGFGAEIGISTQKAHARGPMGLEEITTYKYIIEGNGQIRNQ